MQFSYIFLTLLQAYLVIAARGWVTLVNSTPYTWHLAYSHSYQMRAWQPLKTVEAGTSQEFYYEYSIKTNKDDAAEATYEIPDYKSSAVSSSTQNVSFTLQARSRQHRRIEVQYENGLSTLGNPEHTLLDLGREEEGSIPFVLAGDGIDTPFISNNPPIAWMQASLSTIGRKTIQQISMLASHDSGASEIVKAYIGIRHNTLTQSNHIYGQLKSGTRFLDIRPTLRKGRWYTSHLTRINKATALGALTRTMDNVIHDVNNFTADYPGELIVLDLSHDVRRKEWAKLNDEEWFSLYQKLSAVNDLWNASNFVGIDVTTIPLSKFIQPGSKSAVVLRVPQYAPLPGDKQSTNRNLLAGKNETSSRTDTRNSTEPVAKGATEACTLSSPAAPSLTAIVPTLSADTKDNTTLSHLPVFRTRLFPLRGRWSNTLSSCYLAKNQLAKLRAHKLNKTHSMFTSLWTLTQNWKQVLNVGVPRKSIIALSACAKRQMYKSLWKGIKEERVIPNLIEVDNVWGHNMIAFVMAINQLNSDPPFAVKCNNPISAHDWQKSEEG